MREIVKGLQKNITKNRKQKLMKAMMSLVTKSHASNKKDKITAAEIDIQNMV